MPGIFLTFASFLIFGRGIGFLTQSTGGALFASAFFGIPLIGMLGLLYSALRHWIGRSVVEINSSHISAIDVVGPVRYRSRLRHDLLRQLNVHVRELRRPGNRPNNNDVELEAEFDDDRRLTLASHYPLNVMRELAQRLDREPLLAAALGRAQPDERVELVQHSATSDDSTERTALSEDFKITVESTPHGVRFLLHPTGFFNSIGCFTIIWFTILGAFTYIFSKNASTSQNIDPATLILLLFWLIGIGLALAAFRVGRRTAVIEVDSSSIRIVRTGKKPHLMHLDRSKVTAVRTHVHEHDGGGREVWLDIRCEGEKPLKLFKERDINELKWIASELRHVLGVGWK